MKRTPIWARTAILAAALTAAACAADQTTRRERAASLRDLGEAHLVDGNRRAALRELLRAEAVAPRDPQTHNLLGLAYQESERLDLAVRHFERALELKPDFSQARNNLAVVLLRQEQWEAAVAHLLQLKDDLLYPTPHYAVTNLGYAYYRQGRLDMALAAYQEALKHYSDGFPRDPIYIRVLVGLGRVKLALGRNAEALAHLETAAGLAPAHPEIQFELGRAYAAVGDRPNARHAFGKVEELAPDAELAQKARQASDRL